MNYDPFMRRKRNATDPMRDRRNDPDPLTPLPNYVPSAASGATVGELDRGVSAQLDFNKRLTAPGGFSPYYGNTSYTQEAQRPRSMSPAVYTPPARSGWYAGNKETSDAIAARYGGARNPAGMRPLSAPPSADEPQVDWSQSSAGVAPAAQNSIQRWQGGGTALDQRPAAPPAFTSGQRRFLQTGRIGGHAEPSASERMPLGGTSVTDWRKIFGRNTTL